MAGYKVSHKVLRQQGEDMKAVAKLVDGYAERVAKIRGKLGSDGMLAEVRGNLQKLEVQLGESRTVLNTAGEFLMKTVDSYTGVESQQVKKVDGAKAHNRDFYKNPVVVASVGGGLAGAAAATGGAASPAATSAGGNMANSPAAGMPRAAAESVGPTTANTAPAGKASSGAGAAAGMGAAGGMAGAGAVLGAKHLANKKKKAQSEKQAPRSAGDGYDPQAELEKAIQRMKDLEAE